MCGALEELSVRLGIAEPRMSDRLENRSDRLTRLDGSSVFDHAIAMGDETLSVARSIVRLRALPWSAPRKERAFFCALGTCSIAIGERAWTLGPGDLAIANGPAAVRAVDPVAVDLLVAELDAPLSLAPLVVRSSDLARVPELRTVAGLLREELTRASADLRIAHALIESLARYAARDRGRCDRAHESRPRDRRVARALELLAERPRHRWTIAELAKAVGLSRAAFTRRFAIATGTSPLKHLARSRMELAAIRLRETDDSLAAIAIAIGYESEFAFAKAFKRRFGVPPGVFRRSGSSAPTLRMAA
jgi:AraC-like DNA-binding protein